jgi:hypothetical protein
VPVPVNDSRLSLPPELITSRAGLARSLHVGQSGEIPVKGSNRQVPGLSGDLKYKAVWESGHRPASILVKGQPHYVRVLKRQVLMMEQHLDSR